MIAARQKILQEENWGVKRNATKDIVSLISSAYTMQVSSDTLVNQTANGTKVKR